MLILLLDDDPGSSTGDILSVGVHLQKVSDAPSTSVEEDKAIMQALWVQAHLVVVDLLNMTKGNLILAFSCPIGAGDSDGAVWG